MRRSLFVMVVVLLAVVGPACDSADNPIAPSGTVLTVTAQPSSVDVGGTSTVTVSGIRADGNAASGATVALSTDVGSLSAGTVTLDGMGRGTVVFTAPGAPGAATVTASLGNARASVTIQVTSSDPRIAAEPTSVELDHSRSGSMCEDPIDPRISVSNLGGGDLAWALVDDLPDWLATSADGGDVPDRFRARFTCIVGAGDLDLRHTITLRGLDPATGDPAGGEATVDVLVRVRD